VNCSRGFVCRAQSTHFSTNDLVAHGRAGWWQTSPRVCPQRELQAVGPPFDVVTPLDMATYWYRSSLLTHGRPQEVPHPLPQPSGVLMWALADAVPRRRPRAHSWPAWHTVPRVWAAIPGPGPFVPPAHFVVVDRDPSQLAFRPTTSLKGPHRSECSRTVRPGADRSHADPTPQDRGRFVPPMFPPWPGSWFAPNPWRIRGIGVRPRLFSPQF